MADITLAIANRTYSSWSLRAWLALRHTGLPFEEVVVPLREPETRTEILKYSPSAMLPALITGEFRIWDSLAIIEYLAETCPDAGLWPSDPVARAHARSAAAEMHSGFIPLRRAMPMNLRRKPAPVALDDAAKADINRVQAIWRSCRRQFGAACGKGAFLMGGFSAIDAMYAPVATRFLTYKVDMEDQARSYAEAIMAHPDMKAWVASAHNEPWILDEFEREAEAPQGEGSASPDPA